jgi:tRNA threonylcarbamoyladenosine biosynthesis protein TsaB
VKPLLLALDTTREYGSIALARGPDLLEEILLQAPNGFAHVIYGHLQELLTRHGIGPRDIDCFASAAGPGSFTGVRVGLACVKGLAEACGKPAVGISNLQAVAACGRDRLRAAVLDARRGEVYAAVYDAEGCILEPETVTKFRPWLDRLNYAELEVISTDPDIVSSGLVGTRFEQAAVLTAPRALAAAIARIAYSRLLCGEALDPAVLDANYVRRSDAELFWKE